MLMYLFLILGVLVGNKSDLSERRTVQSSVAQEWAQAHGLDYHETCAVSLSPHTTHLNTIERLKRLNIVVVHKYLTFSETGVFYPEQSRQELF